MMKQFVLILYFLFLGSGVMPVLPLCAEEEPSDSSSQYEYVEYSPLETAYEVYGWNVPRYYYYQYLHLFADYPWVVRVAYGVVFCCVIGFLFITVVMIADVYYIERTKRFYVKTRKEYFEKMKEVCYASVDNLSEEEIARRLDYKPKRWRAWQMRMWARICVDVCQFTNTADPNLKNIQTIMRMIGFTDFVERGLMFGSHKRKVRLLQAVRLTNMRLSDSLVTHLVNDKDPALRKAARVYYMLASKDDPYIFFEDESLTIDTTREANFSLWDKIEIHEIFSKIHDSERALPRFVPLLQTSENRDMMMFFMHETAYWGTERELRHVMTFFESSDLMYRQTAFECMGIRRYAEAEETIKDLFYKQTESLRRTILNALLEINGEHNVDFFVKVYQLKSSDYTRRTALRCLWLSGPNGRELFESLKSTCKQRDLILFEHVENPIINDDNL